MSKVLDDQAVQQAFDRAARAVADGNPDTLAGRFSPRRPEQRADAPAPPPAKVAAGR